jgi:hypothetical protein
MVMQVLWDGVSDPGLAAPQEALQSQDTAVTSCIAPRLCMTSMDSATAWKPRLQPHSLGPQMRWLIRGSTPTKHALSRHRILTPIEPARVLGDPSGVGRRRNVVQRKWHREYASGQLCCISQGLHRSRKVSQVSRPVRSGTPQSMFCSIRLRQPGLQTVCTNPGGPLKLVRKIILQLC